MQNPQQLPDPKLVHDFYRRGLKPQVLRMALLLDVFSPMKDGPVDIQTVAEKCDCNDVGMGFLLECLRSLNLLMKCDDKFCLSPTAETFFVPTKSSYVGEWVLEQTNPDIFRDALQSLRSGIPFNRSVPWEQLAWLESYDMTRIPDSIDMWMAVGIEPDKFAALHILDLACGCSIMSFALAQLYPNVQVTCVDSARVLDVAKDLACRLRIYDQATFISGDLHTLELEVDKYDIVLLGNVTNFFTVQQNLGLFQRAYRSLRSKGMLVVNVTMASQENDEHTSLYSFILWTFSGTNFYAFQDYRNWLNGVGFTSVSQISKLWLFAKK